MASGATTEGTPTTAMAKADNSLLGLLASPDVQAQIAKVATKHLTAEKLMRLVTGEVRKTPALAKCSIASVMRCVMEAARLGLQPGGALGQFYIVPYGSEATPIVGYRGLITLARRSGKIRRLEAHVVYARDVFAVRYGTDPGLTHEPCMDKDRGDIIAAYMVVQMAGDAVQVEVMTRAEIDAVRDRSRASKNGPWVTDYAEMCRKTVVRRGCKYLPMDTEEASPLARAMELDQDDFEAALPEAHRQGRVHPTLRGALRIDDAPEPDDEADPNDPSFGEPRDSE